MTARRITMSSRPEPPSTAEAWVRQDNWQSGSASLAKADLYTARLTIDVTPGLRGRIKIAAFRRDATVAELLRALLEREFPEKGSPSHGES